MDAKPTRPVINLDEVVIEERAAMFQPKGAAAERYSSRMGAIGTRINRPDTSIDYWDGE